MEYGENYVLGLGLSIGLSGLKFSLHLNTGLSACAGIQCPFRARLSGFQHSTYSLLQPELRISNQP